MVDLTKVEGLTDEQKAGLTSLFDDEIGGLKNKVEELLNEKKTVQQGLTEKEQALEDARKAAAKAHEEKLIADGKTDELKTFYEEQLAEKTAALTAEAEKASNALKSRDKADILNKVSSLVSDDFKAVAEPMLSNMLKISYNDQGQATTAFEYDGNVVATDVESFKGWASEQPAFQKILKGVDSGGAGTTQSHGGGAVNDSDSAFKQRLKKAGLTN